MLEVTGGSWIGQNQTDGLLRVDDENATNGKGNAFLVDVGDILVVEHVIGVCDFALLVANDGEPQSAARDLVNVLDPSTRKGKSAAVQSTMQLDIPSVRFDGVCGQTDQLDASLCELGLELCESAQLGGTDWSVVLGMGEENSPLIANPVVKINGAIGCFRLKIGSNRAQSKSCYSVNMIAVIELR